MGTDAPDLLVVGGGVNGAGIARDAAGRGLSVLLVERDDLASHTSSASTKLIHGGLRYLEYYDFRLVREALIERERLLGIAPHIIRALTFVMPLPPSGRPAWLIRLGLFLYDHLAGRRTLPGSKGVALPGTLYGAPLKPAIRRGFTYSDGWVDDARLVVLNAVDAERRGAEILTRTAFVSARREGDRWRATLRDAAGATREVAPRAIVNAAGAWVGRVLGEVGGIGGAAAERPPRLVKGSHLVVPRLYEGEHAYILQNADGRIVFAIPYEDAFTLIGTTDVPEDSPDTAPAITPEETDYLLASVNAYFSRALTPTDVVWSYSGVRPLHDDGRANAAAVTRDYVLSLDADGPPLLSVFGGKITTYRRLAEHALEKLGPHIPMTGAWTATAPLPGGDIADFAAFLADARARWPFLGDALSLRLARAYGTELERILGQARDMAALGPDYGAGLTRAEVDHLVRHEFAREADDILWRRTKLGLHTGPATRAALIAHLAA